MTLSVSRETVMQALWAKLTAATFSQPVNGHTTWVLTSRRVKLFSEVAKEDRPCLFMAERNETPAYRSENNTQVLTMDVMLFVYTDASDPNYTPAIDMNVIMDALDAALSPGPGVQRQTLGGLVSHCRVEGQVLKDPGDIDGDGLLMVPIKIMLT